jgi:hypothetical protein
LDAGLAQHPGARLVDGLRRTPQAEKFIGLR